MLLQGVTPLTSRLRFTHRDWELTRTCLASVAGVLGDPQHAMNVQHLADENLLNEVAAQDEEDKKDDQGSHSVKPCILKPVAKRVPPRRVGGSGSSSSGSSSSAGSVGAKAKPTKRPVVSRLLEEATQKEAPEEEPPTKKPRLSIGWCPTCHCMREACFSPGDWACLLRGQHNRSEDQGWCSNPRCAEPQMSIEPDMVEEVPAPRAFTPWCKSCKKMKSECYKMNDWECPWCGNHNWARKQVLAQDAGRFERHRFCIVILLASDNAGTICIVILFA